MSIAPPFIKMATEQQAMSVRGSVLSSVLGIVCLFLASCTAMYMLVLWFSNEVGDKVSFNLSYDYDGLMSLIHDLKSIREEHWLSILYLFSAFYLFKQTFAIPGSFLLNILAGAIFGLWVGLPLVCILTALGATNAFLVSKLFGRSIVESYLKERIASLKKMISGDGSDSSEILILLSLRLFPNTPNWLINISSPHLGVNIGKFTLSVFFGLMPYNFLCVQAGVFLHFTTLSDVIDSKILAGLAILSIIIISLVVMMKRRKRHKRD